MKILKNEKQILECFEGYSIPTYIKQTEVDGLDLMLCYEDLRNNVSDVIHKGFINAELDSWGEGKAFILDGKYEKILLEIVSTTKDKELKLHCILALAALQIVVKYSIKE